MRIRHPLAAALAVVLVSHGTAHAAAKKAYDVGVTDTEIKIGNTIAYSGSGSAYGQYALSAAAYFRMVNDKGGVQGRKINFISLDNAYSPPKTVEQVRRLVEQDKVFALFENFGTAPNTAIENYVNAKKIPNMFVVSGDSKWADAKKHPYTSSWQLSNHGEARAYAKHIMSTKPDAKIAVLYQNDDYGKDALAGLKEQLGPKVKQIVAEASYELSDATVDSQIVSFKAAGADVFVNISTQKFAAQSIRKAYDIGWKPVFYLNSLASSVGTVLTPAGLEKAVGLISAGYLKEPSDKQWENDAGMKEYLAFMKKYLPNAKVDDGMNVRGYCAAQTFVHVLEQCGDELTRENLMRQAANLKNLQLPMALPGVVINTTPENRWSIRSMQLVRFDGQSWRNFGPIISVD